MSALYERVSILERAVQILGTSNRRVKAFLALGAMTAAAAGYRTRQVMKLHHDHCPDYAYKLTKPSNWLTGEFYFKTSKESPSPVVNDLPEA